MSSTISAAQASKVSDEGTRRRYDLMDMARRIPDVIELGRGDPDLATPTHIVAAAKEAIDRGVAEISDPAGLPELRRAIAEKLARDNGVTVDPKDGVVVTSGGQEALFLLVQTILGPGDEIIVPDPRYTSYDVAIKMAGGVMVSVPTHERDGFDVDPDEVARRITPRTKAILLITPGNPTAGTITPPHIRAIAALAIRHDLLVISDEIYEKFLYDGAEHLSIGSLPGMAQRTITLNGFSKTYAMTGWRIGYAAGPSTFMRELRRRKALCSVCAPVVSQWAALAALRGPQDAVTEFQQIYTRRRTMMLECLDRLGFTYGEPRGAFYVFANTSSTGMDSIDLSAKLLQEAHVLIFPGTGFGEQWVQYLRITLLQPDDMLAEAMRRVERCLGNEADKAMKE
ncbi:MAG: pyridoxal phosphate-dependent aminotransferase [Chloroflexi bacterium]|nr:pyridoxal phosphate-dependent aminotransferase [Chloroflexota bacterium]